MLLFKRLRAHSAGIIEALRLEPETARSDLSGNRLES